MGQRRVLGIGLLALEDAHRGEPIHRRPRELDIHQDQVESLRRFEAASQRSLAALDVVDVTVLKPGEADREHFAGYLPAESWFLLLEPGELEEEGQRYLNRQERSHDVHSLSAELHRRVDAFLSDYVIRMAIFRMAIVRSRSPR